MRVRQAALLALLLVLPATAAGAETGLVIRPADLMAQPFIDAAKVGPVAANQPVEIVARQGAWVNVTAGGRTGWIRALNLRLAGAGAAPGAAASPGNSGERPSVGSLSNPASLLRTGSSGRTVTTGVKGLDEENIRNASVDLQQVEALAALAATPDDARQKAATSKLAESQVDYLKKGKVK